MSLKGSAFLDKNSLYMAIGLLLYTCSVPFWGYNVLKRNRRVLDESRIRFKYEYMYNGIHLTRNRSTIFYWPIYIWRKWVYLMIPTIFVGHPDFQI